MQKKREEYLKSGYGLRSIKKMLINYLKNNETSNLIT